MMPICVLIAALVTSASADDRLPKGPVAGGWSSVMVTDTNVVAAATFAVKAEEKVMRTKAAPAPASLELVAIREAEQQVVAGLNYRLKLTVKLNGKVKKAEAIVWWQAWRKPDPYQLTLWKWK